MRKDFRNSNVKKVSKYTEKQKKMYAAILAAFILFWSIASVLGTIGFIRTFAKEPSPVETCVAEQVVEPIESVHTKRDIIRRRQAIEPTLTQYNYIVDDGWQVNFTALRGAYCSGAYGIDAVLLSRITFKFSIVSGNKFIINNYSTGTFNTNWHSIGDLTWQDTTDIETYPATILVDDRDFDYNLSAVPERLVYYFNGDATCDIVIYFVNIDGTSTPSRLFLTFDFNTVGYDTLFIPSIGGVGAEPGDVYTETITYYTQPQNVYNYNAGYEQGLFDGGQDYYQGWEDGKTAGYADGYSAGYLVGTEDAGGYTFMSLISAVVDAPIQAFTGLFNFEILGVNMLSFATALLTCCVLVAVIKLFI